jgi:sarcosine oxidase subunit gamma
MPETLQRRSALANVYQVGRFGATQPSPGITVQQQQNLSIIQVAAYPDTAHKTAQMIQAFCDLAPADQPRQGVIQERLHILWNGPQRWWIVQPEDATDTTRLARLRADLGVDAAVSEHSQGRIVLRLQGLAVRDLLSKGSAVDFHPMRFQAGWCRPLALDHFDVQLHCLDDSASVDIYIARSLAVSFWEWLLDACGEFGVDVK